MGLYNTHKINKLKDCLEDVEVQKTQLIWVSLDTHQKLNQAAELTNLLKNLYSHSTLADPAYTLTELGISHRKLDNDRHKVFHAPKMAQVHPLSMDLIPPEAVKEILDATVNLATQNQMRLLIDHPSDIFQVKCSYYVKPDSVKLFIHMPIPPSPRLSSLPAEISPISPPLYQHALTASGHGQLPLFSIQTAC
jgi:hypothetical protein